MYSKNIALQPTNKELSANTGLIFFNHLFENLNLSKRLKRILPKKKRNRGPSQISKFKSLLFAFAAGADCLSDLDQLGADSLFSTLSDGCAASRTLGDFLRSLKPRKIALLQELLVDMALTLRMAMYSEDRDFILTMDSTPHQHFAKKKEGMNLNYKNFWCLDSQNAYDQYGFSYLFDLRPGNTYSGKDSELWIRKIFSRIPQGMDRFFRADSAYGKHVVYEALESADAKFTIVLRDCIAKHVRKKNKNLLSWKKTNLYFFDSNDCEIAMGLYPVKKIGNFRVVFIRAPKRDYQADLFDDASERYRYYSIITNFSSSEKSDEEVVEFYRGRATAENFIREQKYGYDFLNFPCQKLDANRVYGLVGTFCYNMMRYLSFCLPQKVKRVRGKDKKIKKVTQSGYFAKKVRFCLIKLPCQVVRHARKLVLKISPQTKEVFDDVMKKISKQSWSPMYST